ncbi:MAG: hypothetical protein AAF797_00245 [Planctomycetota bacterium]
MTAADPNEASQDGINLVITIKKPLDVLVEGLVSAKNRGGQI